MRYLHGIAIWTAALFAAVATGRVVVFLSGANVRSQLTLGTETAAAIGMASVLVGVLAVYLLTRRQPRLALARWDATGAPAPVDYIACLQLRREVLDWRLNVDEPRLCSHYLVACTSWSLCAESEHTGSAGQGTSPAAQEMILVRNIVPEAKTLPLVRRSGTDNCPFRFKSPCVRSVPGACVAPDSSAMVATLR